MTSDEQGNEHDQRGRFAPKPRDESNLPLIPPRWDTGSAEIEGMLVDGFLEMVRPNDYHVEALFDQANLDIQTAIDEAERNPKRAYESLYEAFRGAAAGLLAKQGLAVTRTGGHVAFGDAMRYQIPLRDIADTFHEMRQRRNDFQYPSESTVPVEPVEVTEIVDIVQRYVGPF